LATWRALIWPTALAVTTAYWYHNPELATLKEGYQDLFDLFFSIFNENINTFWLKFLEKSGLNTQNIDELAALTINPTHLLQINITDKAIGLY
jgi:hypothetical protein